MSAQWEQVKGILQSALERPPGEREHFLDNACGDDDSLRQRVETLLASSENVGSFMEQAAIGEVAEMFVNAENSLKTGERFNHYEIISQIGTGGMGEVYLAKDRKLDRKVAIKILNEEYAGHASNLKRFVHEAKAASALNHPNILVIHEIGEFEDAHYIVSEHVEGKTLREIARKSLRTTEILDISVQIASALVATHAAHIVHRDIKPENIIVRPDGFVKVLDFGLAKLVAKKAIGSESTTVRQDQTARGVILGTVNYMSPEQAKGERVDERTDIFSFGILLYEMFAGKPPFERDSMTETLADLMNKEPQPLSRFADGVPDEMQRIVSKALRKDKDARYQTMKGLLADLKELKESLAFDERSERSKPGSENDTAILQAVTSAANQQTAETQSSFSQKLAARKMPAVLALAVLLVATVGFGYRFFAGRSASAAPIDSIAVLPFENMTHDKSTEYLSVGVTESLIDKLSLLPNIHVIASYSAFTYKDQTPNLQQVAKQLNVRAIVTGKVFMQGDTLEIRAELTDPQNNTHLWGDHYTRPSADIFAVQDDIARQVTDSLRVRLTGLQQEQLNKRYTDNADAYRLYSQGRYLLNNFSDENAKRAIQYFDRAIELDPKYALAYAARADAHFSLGDISVPIKEAVPRAQQDALKALSIDSTVSEAQLVLALVKFQYDWNFDEADGEFKQIIARDPNNAEAHDQYAYLLALTGKPLDALPEIRTAQQIDPINPLFAIDANLPYYFARQYEQGIEECRKSVEVFPDSFVGHMALGIGLSMKGEPAAGIIELEKAKALDPNSLVLSNLGWAYGRAGRKDEARKLIADFKEQSKTTYIPPYAVAVIYVGLGENDEALAWLEKAYQDREWWLCWIKMDPKLDSLRSDARFGDLMRRVGFPN